jgi:hypothetical protein
LLAEVLHFLLASLEIEMKIKKYWNEKALMSYSQILMLILASFVFVFLLLPVSAQTWPTVNVCCEKTKSGAWCQNTLEENCQGGFRQTPTSCEATSFCKQGCCYDSSEGLCMENTPQRVCNDVDGTWLDDEECGVSQCELGCCVLGTQASFVTLTRCKRLSGLYGLETNFRTDVADEMTCIAIAASQDQGACVYESEYQRSCKFTTRGECQGIQSTGNMSESEFYKDYLCSAEELATICGPSSETTCVGGKDEVYFKDTCGNPANIYDAGKINDKSYWKKVVDKNESCGAGRNDGNAESTSCGNCDYFKGSICNKGSATYGKNICTDLDCYNTENGEDYKNGESWCVYDGKVGEGADAVGSRHFRHVCIHGEETIEPCDDYRNKVCIEGEIEAGGETFIEAACRVNRWIDCIDQDEEEDCLNTDKRDCYWREGLHFTGLTKTTGVTGQAILGGDDDIDSTLGVQLGEEACLPDVPPGLKFWQEGDAESVCSSGNSVCVVKYEQKLTGSKNCVENCECLEAGWVNGKSQEIKRQLEKQL